MFLYLCSACERGDHAHCDGSHPAPPGFDGGRSCNCVHAEHFPTSPNEAEKENSGESPIERIRNEIAITAEDSQFKEDLISLCNAVEIGNRENANLRKLAVESGAYYHEQFVALTSKIVELEAREQSHAINYTIASQRGNRYADENEKLRQELEKMRGEG